MKSNFILSAFVTSTAIFFSPIYGLILIISLAVATDTGYGIYSAIKTNGIKSFSSHKLFNIVPKTFLYMSTILFAFLIDNFFFEKQVNNIPFAVSKIVTAAWTLVELKSIDETRTKLGHKSLFVLAREAYFSIRGIKKNLDEL